MLLVTETQSFHSISLFYSLSVSLINCFFVCTLVFYLIVGCLVHVVLVSTRLKPVHKVEGMTNGTAVGAGQQQQQQGSGHVDISTQVQQYQQFLGEFSAQWIYMYTYESTDSDEDLCEV